jgi:hypothetical protein
VLFGEVVAPVEPVFRRWMKIRTSARRDGYENYAAAKLAHDGLDIPSLLDLFASWQRTAMAEFAATRLWIEKRLGYTLYAEDLHFGLSLLRKEIPIEISGREALGTDFETLPVSFEIHRDAFYNAGYRVELLRDIRIVLTESLTNIGAVRTVLHEFGHAFYYCHCPRETQLLIDGHLMREILAHVCECFLDAPWTWVQVGGFASKEALSIVRHRNLSNSLRWLLYMRFCIFTFRVLLQPYRPFADIWNDVSTEILGMEDHSGAFVDYEFPTSLEMKSVAFAHALSQGIFNAAVGVPLSRFDGPPFLGRFINRFCEPGNTVEWQDKLNVRV